MSIKHEWRNLLLESSFIGIQFGKSFPHDIYNILTASNSQWIHNGLVQYDVLDLGQYLLRYWLVVDTKPLNEPVLIYYQLNPW